MATRGLHLWLTVALLGALVTLYGSPAFSQPTTRSVVLRPSPATHHLTPVWQIETVTPREGLEQPERDPWLAYDKLQHVTFSFLWTLGSQYTLVNKTEWKEMNALPVSVGLASTVGLAKEVYDWRVGATRTFSRRDLVADALGIAFAAGLILL